MTKILIALACLTSTASHAACDQNAAVSQALQASEPSAIIASCTAEGADWDTLAPSGEPYLIDAIVIKENAALAIALLEAGANPNSLDSYGDSALINAVVGGTLFDEIAVDMQATAAALLAYRADPYLEGQFGLFPLLASANTSQGMEMTRLLVENGVDPRFVSSRGHSALFATVQGSCHVEIGTYLLDQGARLSDLPAQTRELALTFGPLLCTANAEQRAFAERLLATQ